MPNNIAKRIKIFSSAQANPLSISFGLVLWKIKRGDLQEELFECSEQWVWIVVLSAQVSSGSDHKSIGNIVLSRANCFVGIGSIYVFTLTWSISEWCRISMDYPDSLNRHQVRHRNMSRCCRESAAEQLCRVAPADRWRIQIQPQFIDHKCRTRDSHGLQWNSICRIATTWSLSFCMQR